MKKIILLTFFLFFASLIFGQESIDQLVLDQQNLQKNAMLVLGGFGALVIYKFSKSFGLQLHKMRNSAYLSSG